MSGQLAEWLNFNEWPSMAIHTIEWNGTERNEMVQKKER